MSSQEGDVWTQRPTHTGRSPVGWRQGWAVSLSSKERRGRWQTSRSGGRPWMETAPQAPWARASGLQTVAGQVSVVPAARHVGRCYSSLGTLVLTIRAAWPSVWGWSRCPLSKSLKSLTGFPNYKKQLFKETYESSCVTMPGTEPGAHGHKERKEASSSSSQGSEKV